MGNVFDLINSFIHNNSQQTYGEILENNKSQQKENAIKRMCSHDEYEQYENIAAADKKRIINESNTNLTDNWLSGNNFKREQNIPGIGKVTQIC